MKTNNEIILSAEGLKKIEEELHQLRTVHRKRVADRIRDALQFGDSAENNEFEDAKNEQAMVEGRIEELKRIVSSAVVLDNNEVTTDQVGIGCIVTVKDNETDDEWEWSIVGTIEADPAEGKISNESPVGQALIGKKVGDKVRVEIPAGIAQYEIVDIRK